MPDYDVEEHVRREVEAARKILREDRILAKLNKHFPDESPESDDGSPNPPKRKENPSGSTADTKKPGIWWGSATADE